MEMELKGIIEKIKEEGVTEAEKQAANIIAEAEGKQKEIRDTAEKEKAAIIKSAQEDAENLKRNGEEALKQASRDVLLALRERIIVLFDKVTKAEVSKELSPDLMKAMIVKLAENAAQKNSSDLEILLSDDDKSSLEQGLLGKLQKEMSQGVTIKASKSVEHGFRIGAKDTNEYYDFTDEAVSEVFTAYLNPRIAKILELDKNE